MAQAAAGPGRRGGLRLVLPPADRPGALRREHRREPPRHALRLDPGGPRLRRPRPAGPRLLPGRFGQPDGGGRGPGRRSRLRRLRPGLDRLRSLGTDQHVGIGERRRAHPGPGPRGHGGRRGRHRRRRAHRSPRTPGGGPDRLPRQFGRRSGTARDRRARRRRRPGVGTGHAPAAPPAPPASAASWASPPISTRRCAAALGQHRRHAGAGRSVPRTGSARPSTRGTAQNWKVPTKKVPVALYSGSPFAVPPAPTPPRSTTLPPVRAICRPST